MDFGEALSIMFEVFQQLRLSEWGVLVFSHTTVSIVYIKVTRRVRPQGLGNPIYCFSVTLLQPNRFSVPAFYSTQDNKRFVRYSSTRYVISRVWQVHSKQWNILYVA